MVRIISSVVVLAIVVVLGWLLIRSAPGVFDLSGPSDAELAQFEPVRGMERQSTTTVADAEPGIGSGAVSSVAGDARASIPLTEADDNGTEPLTEPLTEPRVVETDEDIETSTPRGVGANDIVSTGRTEVVAEGAEGEDTIGTTENAEEAVGGVLRDETPAAGVTADVDAAEIDIDADPQTKAGDAGGEPLPEPIADEAAPASAPEMSPQDEAPPQGEDAGSEATGSPNPLPEAPEAAAIETVLLLLEGSDLPKVQKEALSAQVDGAKGDPDALSEALDEVRRALGLDE